MVEGPNREWVGSPLDTDSIGGMSGDGIEKIVIEFDEGEEILTSRLNERFGSYDLYEAGHYIHSLSSRLVQGDEG
jgi:hypothetical protein